MVLSKLVCTVLLMLGAATPIEAKKTMRTVQVIGMNTPSSSSAGGVSVQDLDADDEGGRSISATSLSNLRIHDLGRRSVEFDMRNRFTSLASAVQNVGTEDANSFAPFEMSRTPFIPRVANQPPASIIAVPPWMQGGLAVPAASTSFLPGCIAGDYRPSGFLRPAPERRRFSYYTLMSSIACEYGVPVALFDAMIIRESRYRADIFSPTNAFGLTQLMPGTAAGLGVDRYDVEQNLRGGARYLRQQLDRFGRVHLALAAYNAGPSRVRNGSIPRIAETLDYVDKVLSYWQRLTGLQSDRRYRAYGPGTLPILAASDRKAKISLF